MSTLNETYRARAHRFIPGGAHTYSRGDDQYPSNAPAVLERGKGAYVWDADGNRFLDYGMALRAVTVGYGYERIANAAIREIAKGNALTRASTVEIDAAEDFTRLIPSADMVKFAKNGSTVTSAAVKLARAYTGRTLVARCLQHPFFSYDDWFIGDTVMKSGVPSEVQALTKNFVYNDIDSLKSLLEAHPGKFACVILEPATLEEPKVYANGRNFLQEIRELCDRHGCVYILDEMITGFRWHLQGASKHYNVTPDLVTFGKGMANGFSVAAMGGKREIMELGGIHHQRERVFLISTTHGAEMCGMGAFRETLKVYQELDVVGQMWKYGRKLIDLMNTCARDAGISQQFEAYGVPCSPGFITRDRDGQPSMHFRALFSQEMIKGGVLIPWIALCYEHGDVELEITEKALRSSFSVYARALEDGVSKHLVGEPLKPVFRKHN